MYAPAFKIVSSSSQTVNPQISLLFSPARMETLEKKFGRTPNVVARAWQWDICRQAMRHAVMQYA